MRRLLASGVVVATALALFAPVMGAAPAQGAAGTTVVLSFDDGVVNQSVVPAMLEAHGMRGTFYVNSNAIGTPGYLTWAQLVSFQAAGHEIGGHTLDHMNLDTITVAQAQTQVCNDRTAIMSHGLTVTDFAYPYGAGYETAAVRTVVQGCGYSSARRAWGLYSTDPACGTNGCGYPYAGTVPPADPWGVETADNPQTATTLAQIETLVTQAETHGGGLVPLVFHEICAGCDPYSTTQATLQAFLDWLQPRTESGTIVKTMAQVMTGDTTAAASSIACNGAPCSSGWYGSSPQVSLSAADNAGGSGVASIRYTTDGSTPGFASSIYSAPFSLSSTKTVKYRAYDSAGNPETTKSQLVQIDAVAPTSAIQCNGSACSSVGYATPAQVTLSATDSGGAGIAAIRYTTDGTDPTSSSTVYSAPFTVSSTTTVKYRAFDNAANAEATKSQAILLDTDAPVSSITCNGVACSGGWYRGAVQVSLSATDIGSGVAAIRYTTDGSTPTVASPVYSAPFVFNSSTNVSYGAVDNAGNAGLITTTFVRIDTTGPTVAITSPGNHASVTRRVKVTARATDVRSGITKVDFYVDGKLVAAHATPAYSFTWNTTKVSKRLHTLTAKAFDGAGNSTTKSITVTVR